MEFEIVKNTVVSIGKQLAVVTKTDGEILTGVVDGPFAGYPKSNLEAYRKDYLYVNRIDKANNPIERVYLDEIESIVEKN
jgi:hypothetical protein